MRKSKLMLYLWCLSPAVVQAQALGAKTAPAADTKADDVANEPGAIERDIIVTGSRIERDGFEAPTPVSIITEAQIQQSAPANIADYVNQLPSLLGGESPRTPRGNLAAGNAGANYLNLRNLGAPRTLVLLNGRRVTPSNLTGSTDINILPSALIKRVDVVTGGASAAWGSDAVAGVVNFVLDTGYTGLKGSIQGGSSTRGDAESIDGSLSYGAGFADDRGHILLSGHYAKSGAAYLRDRGWFNAPKILTNPAFVAGNGQPARIIVQNGALLVNDTGLIASGPLRGTFFDASGNVAGTNFQFPPTSSGIYGGGSKAIYDTLADQAGRYGQASVPIEQGSFYGRLSYDISDSVNAFVEGSWSKAQTRTTIANFFRTGNTAIAITNFYVPTALRTAMTTAGVTSVPLSTSNVKLGVLQSAVGRENIRVLSGVEGKFGDGWTYGLSYQYGKTDVKVRSPNNIRPSLYALAVDAVADPSNPSQPICRSTLTNPTNGCVPVNPFGSAPMTDAQLGYLLGNSIQDLTYRQDVATANIAGDLFDLPAGPVSLAAGGEYRRERAVDTSDAISQTNGYYAGNYKPFSGRYSVKEAFAELAVPVFRDSAIGKMLDLNFAGRLTDYSTSGSVVTWKAGFIYKPVEDIQLRLTRSRDIRAPNLNELFLTGTVATQNVSDPFNGGANAQFLQTTRGNPGLSPEEADTLTVGLVLKPSFLPGFGMSIDYYDIKIGDAIATNSSQFTVNRCAAGDVISCAAITRNANNIITGITLQPFNTLSEVARGVDVELSYRTDIGAGSLELRGLVNYTGKLEIVTPTTVIDRAGEVGNNVGAAEGVPRIRALASIAYTNGPLTTQLKTRFVGKSKMDRQWAAKDVSINDVPAVAYLDAYIGYKLNIGGNQMELFVAGDNILDKSPPLVVNQDNSLLVSAGTNVFLYDVIGASFRTGLRFEF